MKIHYIIMKSIILRDYVMYLRNSLLQKLIIMKFTITVGKVIKNS